MYGFFFIIWQSYPDRCVKNDAPGFHHYFRAQTNEIFIILTQSFSIRFCENFSFFFFIIRVIFLCLQMFCVDDFWFVRLFVRLHWNGTQDMRAILKGGHGFVGGRDQTFLIFQTLTYTFFRIKSGRATNACDGQYRSARTTKPFNQLLPSVWFCFGRAHILREN